MPGNRLGPKKNYIYQTDVTNIVYIISRDEDLAIAGFGAGTAAPVEFDPENPPAGKTVLTAPKRFVPRTVFIQSTDDGARKDMVAFDPTSQFYVSTQRTNIPDIDGDATFETTGRKGEAITF